MVATIVPAPAGHTVEPFRVGLNGGTAYWMARFSEAAYRRLPDGSPDAVKILAELKADDDGVLAVTPFHDHGASAVLIEHDNYFALAFRGTDEPRDWLDNFNMIPKVALFGSFHRGFFDATDRLWPSLLAHYQLTRARLRETSSHPKGLFITGHSLGGAMATVAAAQLIHRDVGFTGVYTFGQPRVMRPKTADVFNVRAQARFYRFQNNNDIVTRMPSRASGYSHVGSYVHINQDRSIVREPGLWLQFLDVKDGIADDIHDRDFGTITDHYMADYLLAITPWDLQLSS
jgi:triacylglycerol lipase